jgi:ethanolamine ammonia-lyase small subunit
MSENPALVVSNPWQTLRQFTDARIALGRAGVSLPTQAHLAFQLAHANARDAVHWALDTGQLAAQLDASLPDAPVPCLQLQSAAESRAQYLQRPDWGRRLSAGSRSQLENLSPHGVVAGHPYDLALVVADGLSALAIEKNAVPFINTLLPLLAQHNWKLAPLSIVSQGRVAIGDEVGALLGARAVLVLIGERPGLSSPDSMGLYLTWMPRVGLTDAARNCISNVRPAGIHYPQAASKLLYLLNEARRRGLSGVDLKDETPTDDAVLAGTTASRNFLLGG